MSTSQGIEPVISELKSIAKKHLKALKDQHNSDYDELLLKVFPGFTKSDLQLKHVHDVMARELGFPNWRGLIDQWQKDQITDWGSLFYPKYCDSIYLNIWCRNLDEALEVKSDSKKWLLPFKNQFMLVDLDFMNALTQSGSETWPLIWDSYSNLAENLGSPVRQTLKYRFDRWLNGRRIPK